MRTLDPCREPRHSLEIGSHPWAVEGFVILIFLLSILILAFFLRKDLIK